MSFKTWADNVYGIEITPDWNLSSEKIIELLKNAPKTKKQVEDCLKGIDVPFEEVSSENCIDFEDAISSETGVHVIIANAISEAENITICPMTDGYDCRYLAFFPRYPWEKIKDRSMSISQEELDSIFKKYGKMFTEEDVHPDYLSIENWG